MPVSRKLVKVATKLKKLWPRKKKKKLLQPPLPPPPAIWIKEPPPPPSPRLEYYYLPPPPYGFNFTCSSSSFQPSAPPLPPWLDLEPEPEPELKTKGDESVLLLSNTASSSSYHVSSYQQYTVESPDYGGAVAAQQQPKGRRARDGFFGWVVGFVVNVFGCFCPCLRVTEAR